MQCPFCLETIIDGAKLCRFCGKKQPLKGREKFLRDQARTKRMNVVLPAGVILAIFLILVIAGMDASARERRLRQAAACAGLSFEELKRSTERAASSGKVTVTEAEDFTIGLVCPRMINGN